MRELIRKECNFLLMKEHLNQFRIFLKCVNLYQNSAG